MGEERAAKLLYLIATSARFLPKPVSAVPRGTSSVGKSETVSKVLAFIPPSMYRVFTSLSEKVLFHSPEPLSHRTMVIYEHAGISGDYLDYVFRSLISEQRLVHETLVPSPGGKFKPEKLIKEGPTNIITTTTKVKIDPEMENRVISIPFNDTAPQTRAIIEAQAAQATRGVSERPDIAVAKAVDLGPWHALQEWLALSKSRIVIPFAKHLAPKRTNAVRLRRDFPVVLALIQVHAALHQATRKRTKSGKIIARWEDYRVVYDLFGDLIAEGIKVSVSPTVRETVHAVMHLLKKKAQPLDSDKGGVRVVDVAKELSLDQSSTLRRVRAGRDGGLPQKSRRAKAWPARLMTGVPLPNGQSVLPEPREVKATMAKEVQP